MGTHTIKEERIELRVSAEEKEVFLRAQKLSGDKSFSSFMVRVLKKHAEEILAQHDRILATERDRAVFFDAVFGNLEPNEALRRAADKYRAKGESR